MRKLSLFRVLLGSALVSVVACDAGEVDGVDDQVDGQGAALEGAAPGADARANLAALTKANLVSVAEATRLAEDFAAEAFGRDTRPVVGSTHVERDERTGDPAMYVFNFRGGGFVLVAADKRQVPILGFDEVEDFEALGVAEKRAPEGVRGMVLQTKQHIYDIRTGVTPPVTDARGFEQFHQRLDQFRPQGDHTDNFEIPNPDTCTGSYSHTFELNFPMKWDQGCGWNDSAPTVSGGPCGRAWAGCVAVAVGQVMKYYSYPSSFNWSAMSATSPTATSAQLLRNIGDRLDMDWGADSSSSDTEDADNVLEGFGYSTTASYSGHSFDKVRAELAAGRPVIMRGTRDCDFLGFPTCGGHAWVVVGVKDTYDCGSQTYPRFYKMNWGWGGSYNGWYATYGLTPGGNNYNYHQEVVTGIKP